MNPDGFLPAAPYHLMDNPYTLLDKSDLVMVDAIGTGFSRAASIKDSKKFWSVKGDIEAFSEFIRLYLSRYERWGSPLFLFGESYGTTRAAGIAGYLALGFLAYTRRRITLLVAALIGLGFALHLSYIEKYVLEVWCLYCVISQGIIALITLLSAGWLIADALAMSRERKAASA